MTKGWADWDSLRQIGCPTGKVEHTREKALAHRAHLRRGGRRDVEVYRCAECGAWHVGRLVRRRQSSAARS